MKSLEVIQRESWDEALHCYGTAHVFEVRSNLLRRRLRVLTFLGVAVPATVGITYMSFGANFPLTGFLVFVGSLLLIVQLTVSLWSIVAKWDDGFAYSLESMTANRQFFDRFRDLASDPPGEREANSRYQILQRESEARSKEDEKQGFTENEKRMGMRAALRQTQRKCAACGQIPTSMTPAECDVCGNFHVPRI